MNLDNIIYRALFEQRTGKIKKVPVDVPIPIEVPDTIPDVRRNKIKSANRKGLQVAQQHGAVLDVWSAFSVILNASKPGKEILPQISSAANAVNAINQLTKEKGGIHYGAGGELDKTTKSGNPKYMYIVGPNVSKIKRIFKYNVWVCNYDQLITISRKINQIEPLQYYNIVVSNAAKFTVGRIPVFMYAEAVKWFQSLQTRIDALKTNTAEYNKIKLDLKPVNSRVLIPELQYLNADYDPKETNTAGGTIEITNQNYEQYGNTGFRGFAKLDLDAYGNQILIPQKGTMPVTRYSDEMSGTFTGEFFNGAPHIGNVNWDDETIESVKPGDTKIYIDSSGKRRFTFYTANTTTKEMPLRVTYRDTPEIIKLLQQDIKAMLDNNPEWVNSLSTTKYADNIKNFTPDGNWWDNMRAMSLLLNAEFLKDAAIDPATGSFYRGITTEIPESVRQNIIKYKTEKIPL